MLPLILDEADVQESKKKCEEMAEKFAITDLLDKKPYELSGGEKQRISIARSILKNAPIIILDEATASIDSDNESYIQEAIDALVNGKILLVIAHRLNTIKNANQILVLDEGKITEHGTHEELIIQDGLYRCLWSSQQNTGTWKIN